MTLYQIFEEEPRLYELSNKARRLKGSGRNVRSTWYGFSGLKKDMVKLVGWGATSERLRGSDTYDKIYQHFINILEL